MFKAGTKFSSKPRNGYDFIYEILGEKSTNFIVRNTSFPEYDTRGKERLVSKETIATGFFEGDYIILN
jgi:hypothetical protein